MGVPIYAFSRMTARPEYNRLQEEGRSAAWWEAVRQVGEQEKASGVQSVVSCRGVVDGPDLLLVKRYPDMETFIRYWGIWLPKTHMQKYFDFRVELGCTDEDVKKAFGETKAEPTTW